VTILFRSTFAAEAGGLPAMNAIRQANAKAIVSRETVRSLTPRTGLLCSGAIVPVIASVCWGIPQLLALRLF